MDTEKKESKPKAKKPVMPAIYEDGSINMHSSMITDKDAFIKLWKGTKAAKGLNLDKAWKKADSWASKFK